MDKTEKQSIDALLEKGISVEIGDKEYHLHEPTLGMLDEITSIQLKMNIDEDALEKDLLSEAKRIVADNINEVVSVVAIMVVGARSYSYNRIVDKVFSWFWWLKVYRAGRKMKQTLTPSKLLNLTPNSAFLPRLKV